MNMNRRELIARVAYLLGGAVSAPAVMAVLNGCSAKQSTAALGWKPAFLTEEQAEVVSVVADIMIPRTDTPGAVDAGVPAFIDTVLKDAYPKKDQERYIAGLQELDAQAAREHGKSFIQLEPAQRVKFVQSIHDVATASERQLNLPPGQVQRPFILMTKELTLLGFFTSEPGATQVLQYLPIPGAWHACIPVSEAGNGKTWATEPSVRF